MKESEQQVEENKHVLRQIIFAVEFLAKQALLFRGHHEDKVDFSSEDTNRGNFIVTLQLMSNGDSILHKHLLHSKGNAKYTLKIRLSTSMLVRSEKDLLNSCEKITYHSPA